MWFACKWGSWRCSALANKEERQSSVFTAVCERKPETQIITMPTTSDTTRAEPENFLIHLNVKAAFAALPPRESPQAAKRPVVSHLFTPASCWVSLGLWRRNPMILSAISDSSRPGNINQGLWASLGDRRQAWMAPAQDNWTEGGDLGPADNFDVQTLPGF